MGYWSFKGLVVALELFRQRGKGGGFLKKGEKDIKSYLLKYSNQLVVKLLRECAD